MKETLQMKNISLYIYFPNLTIAPSIRRHNRVVMAPEKKTKRNPFLIFLTVVFLKV